MVGIEDGVDRVATTALLHGRRLSNNQKGILRNILAGAIRTQQWLRTANLAEDACCPDCGHANEDLTHMWWLCPAWNHIREKHMTVLFQWREEWPPCYQLCGVMPEHHPSFEHLLLVSLSRESDEEEEGGMDLHQALDQAWVEEFIVDGMVVVYSDGACTCNQDSRFRRAGCGGFRARGHCLNF